MSLQKNPLENFQEIPSQKVLLDLSPDSLPTKQFYLFQIPKNVGKIPSKILKKLKIPLKFDPKDLNGIEIDVNESQSLLIPEGENVDFDHIIERMDSNGEKYYQDQVLILKPQQGKSRFQPISIEIFT